MDERELRYAYFAGFFDGEGWINFTRYRPRNRKTNRKLGMYQPPPKVQIGIGNTNLSVILEFQKEFGGRKILRKKTKLLDIWILGLHGNTMKSFLKKVFPYLIVKKPLAELALQFLETWKIRSAPYYKLTSDDREKRELILFQAKRLKEIERENSTKEVN